MYHRPDISHPYNLIVKAFALLQLYISNKETSKKVRTILLHSNLWVTIGTFRLLLNLDVYFNAARIDRRCILRILTL